MAEEIPIDPDLQPLAPSMPAPGRGPLAAQVPILCFIALGGAAGSLVRVGLGEVFAEQAGHFPLTTFGVNVTGSFALGALVVGLIARRPHSRYLGPLFATGLLGAYTTFSTFAVGSVNLFRDGHAVTAFSYLALSIVTGVVAAWLGILLGLRVRPARAPASA